MSESVLVFVCVCVSESVLVCVCVCIDILLQMCKIHILLCVVFFDLDLSLHEESTLLLFNF